MQITADMVRDWITDGVASAVQAAKGDADAIAAQMTAELNTNKSKRSSNTIRLPVTIKLDAETRQVKITGGYGFTTPNLGDEAPEIIREIPDPNQPELTAADGSPMATVDATTPNPDDESDD